MNEWIEKGRRLHDQRPFFVFIYTPARKSQMTELHSSGFCT